MSHFQKHNKVLWTGT